MIRRPPRSTRTDTLFPYTTLFRSNLSVTQSTLSKMEEGISNTETGEHETLWTVPSVFSAVQLVGRLLRETRAEVTSGLHADEAIDFGAHMLMVGRDGGAALSLYLYYDAGNAIDGQPYTPYLIPEARRIVS